MVVGLGHRSPGLPVEPPSMPATLKKLMRHASIETTMASYVGDNARATAADPRDAVKMGQGTSSGTSRPIDPTGEHPRNDETPAIAGVS